MLKKREKFANPNADKKHEGVFGVLYRPEGKMLSRLSEKSEEPFVQSPQNIGILGSRIPMKVLESEED